MGGDRYVCIGEASHGTHEFYEWRCELSRRLIEEHGFTWIGVEGDWPDCWRINRWVRGVEDPWSDARDLLAGFERWPTWMWANEEVARFLTWLRGWNLSRRRRSGCGFYGLDVYSLWDSLREIIGWLEVHAPDSVAAALQAWQCFVPYQEDPHRYAWSTRLVPESCEPDVVALLAEVRRRTGGRPQDDEDAFDAWQNAEVAVDAERYYRIMVQGDRESWNVRDHHMVDTVERVAGHLGDRSKGLVWEHNTHVGDARATDMARAGLVNVGQLMRERHGDEGRVAGRVRLPPGFGGGRPGPGASRSRSLVVPAARQGSHEDLLHAALGEPAVLDLGGAEGPWSASWLGHRAIGVVLRPPAGSRELRPDAHGCPLRRTDLARGDDGPPSAPP